MKVTVDAGAAGGEMDRSWRFIGFDECNYVQAPEGQELLARIGALEEAPCHVRMHHLLCTGNCHGSPKWGSTNVYRENTAGAPIFSWETLDEIIGTLLSRNCKPFFELGFLPMDLVDRRLFGRAEPWERYGLYRGGLWAHPPKDLGRWRALVRAIAAHCAERFGEAEVLSWYWELWNEPDIFYWKGTVDQFCALYDYTEAALHDILPTARLGGPSTTGPTDGSRSLKFLLHFLRHCAAGRNAVSGKRGARLDFVTFHVKGGGFPFDPAAGKSTPSLERFALQVRAGFRAVTECGFADREVVISEADPDGWAAGGRRDNPNLEFRNTEYYASFVAASYALIEEEARSMRMRVRPLAWAFLFVGERCFEGARTLSTQGIEKAVFNLFRMYGRLGRKALPVVQSNLPSSGSPFTAARAAIADDGAIQVLIASHHDDWDFHVEQEVVVTLTGLRFTGPVQVSHFRIDSDHSNPFAEWVRLGRPPYPDSVQRASIQARSGLETLPLEISGGSDPGTFVCRFPLPAHGISLIELRRRT